MKVIGLVVLCIVLSSVVSIIVSRYFFQSHSDKPITTAVKGLMVSPTPTLIPTQIIPSPSIVPTKVTSANDCKNTYNRQAAKNEGYTDEEINSYLNSLPPGPCPKQIPQPQSTTINNTTNESKPVHCTTQYNGTMAYTTCN